MARIGNKKAFTVHLSDEMAAMIDLKRKEHGAESRRLALIALMQSLSSQAVQDV